MRHFKKIPLVLIGALMMSGCVIKTAANNADANYQEDILLKAKNYDGLINLYRSRLKKKDTPETRISLSRYYYLANDYKSSLYYLQPLNNTPTISLYILQAKNMIAMGDYTPAIRVTDKMLQKEPQNAEAYNLRGVALALSGKLEGGQRAIETSRQLFIADDVAINNLAMIAMIDHRYQDALGLLLPQYLRGRKQREILHNLVLVLVKVGDRRYARTIIENESLSTHPDELIDALAITSPVAKGRS